MFLLYFGGSSCIEIISYINDLKISKKSNIFFIVDKNPIKNRFKEIKNKVIFYKSINKIKKINFKKIIITAGDPSLRNKALKELKKCKLRPSTLIHPTAYVAENSKISYGSILAPFTLVAPFAKIGENCFMNSYSSIGHHSIIGKSNVFSPYSTVNGNCKIGNGNFLGTGAVINPSIEIGKNNKVSSNSVLKKNVRNDCLIHGNPAKAKSFF